MWVTGPKEFDNGWITETSHNWLTGVTGNTLSTKAIPRDIQNKINIAVAQANERRANSLLGRLKSWGQAMLGLDKAVNEL